MCVCVDGWSWPGTLHGEMSSGRQAETGYRRSLSSSLNTLKDSEEEYHSDTLYSSLILHAHTALRAVQFMGPSHKTPGQGAVYPTACWWGWGTRVTLLGQSTDTGPDSDFPRKDSALSCLLEPSLNSTNPSLSFPDFFFPYSLFTRLEVSMYHITRIKMHPFPTLNNCILL